MKRQPDVPPAPTPLRRRAEVLLHQLAVEKQTGARAPRSAADTERLLHELQVHQIELETQNEELQSARDEIEAGLAKYSDLYDFAPVGYLTLTPDGTIREANLTAATLLGVPRGELVKLRLAGFAAPAQRPLLADFLDRVFAGAAQQECELRLLPKKLPPVEVRLRANRAETDRECRVTVSDITASKQAEADRLVLRKLESTGILAGGIAHDFNNLLTVILLNLELAELSAPPHRPLAGHLTEARRAGRRAQDLTQQLITFAEGGRPVRKPTRLSGVIQESARLTLDDPRWTCEFTLLDDTGLVAADSAQIGQVVRNLVRNAREAMPDGGRITVRLEPVVLASGMNHTLPAGPYLRISITDRGDGIAPEVLPRIFDPYFSTKLMGTQKGMGLGLTICHAIIRKHDGAITVESVEGKGTTIHVYLPASGPAPGPDQSAATPASPGIRAHSPAT